MHTASLPQIAAVLTPSAARSHTSRASLSMMAITWGAMVADEGDKHAARPVHIRERRGVAISAPPVEVPHSPAEGAKRQGRGHGALLFTQCGGACPGLQDRRGGSPAPSHPSTCALDRHGDAPGAAAHRCPKSLCFPASAGRRGTPPYATIGLFLTNPLNYLYEPGMERPCV